MSVRAAAESSVLEAGKSRIAAFAVPSAGAGELTVYRAELGPPASTSDHSHDREEAPPWTR